MDHSEGLRADVLANPIPDPTSPTGAAEMSEYVTVPREPTPEMIAAGRKVRQDGFSEIAIFDAMIAAAPPSPPPSSVKAREIDAFEAGYIQGHDATVEGRYADPSDAAQDYVRTLLVPAVDERAASSEPEMCPNCVTPWKCNGPHEFPQAASSEAAVAFDAERFERAPCYLCGYNGRGYYQPETHPCAAKYHAHPAPTTADAGVTEAMVETFEAKFLECARTRPDSTLRDDIRAALEAALSAREGK